VSTWADILAVVLLDPAAAVAAAVTI